MSRRLLVTLFVCLLATTFTVLASGAHGDQSASLEMPANIVVEGALADIVRDMLERSPAFRQQWRSLGRMPRVRVRIRLNDLPSADPTVRAQCALSRYQYGGIAAMIDVRSLLNAPELVAHELEHVVEFAEGINYRALAIQNRGAAWLSGGGHFETRRAIEAGERVADEMDRTSSKFKVQSSK